MNTLLAPELLQAKTAAGNRAYATLEVKAFQDTSGRRLFKGIASTPAVDRSQDVVDPNGIQYELPLPFLWQHSKDDPIGWITSAKKTARGIEVEGEVAQIEEEGELKSRLTRAWQTLRAGLVKGLSIGFLPLEVEQIKGTRGVLFKRISWFELSAVTIPCNAECSLATIKAADLEIIKSLDQLSPEERTKTTDSALVAASGNPQSEVTHLPGVSGNNSNTPNPRTPKGSKVKPIADQIKDLENTRAAQSARMEECMKASLTEGRASTEEEGDEFDSLEAEVKRLDGDLVRLRKLEAMQVAKATPVTVQANGGNAMEVRNGAIISVKAAQLPPGIAFARFAMTMAAARGNPGSALDIAKAHYPEMHDLHNVIEMAKGMGTSDFGGIMKTAVAAGTTQGTTFAAPLVQYQNFAGDFLEYLRPQTIIGKFGTNGIPALRRVPFNVKIPSQTSGGAAGWVGEGAAKPLTTFDFASTTMGWTKVAAIAVLTEELIRFSSPSAEALVRDSLASAVIERIDIDFVLPSKAAVSNVSPASITNGASTAASAGTTEVDVRTDIRTIMGLYIAANMTPTNGVWIMPATIALQLSMLTNALGNSVFPGITMNGGTFAGIPVIVSQYVPSGVVILANASDIYLADDGQVVIDASREASLEMNTAPTGTSVTPTGTSVVSMFATNSVAIRAERYVNWQRRRAAGVAYLTSVNYTG